VGKTGRERSDRRRRRFAADAPITWLSTRLFTIGRIKSAAAVIASTRAGEPFFRGDEPERSPSHTVVASPRCGGEPTRAIIRSHSKREIFRSDSRIDWPKSRCGGADCASRCSVVGRLSSAILEFLRRDGGRQCSPSALDVSQLILIERLTSSIPARKVRACPVLRRGPILPLPAIRGG